MDDIEKTHRPLGPREEEILHRLLSVPFPGREELLAQLPQTWVSGTCACGCPSVALTVNRPQVGRAPVRRRIPIEGRTRDSDGTPVEVLLHVRDGYLSELEIYRVDSKPPGLPVPDSIELWSLEP
jgi:hypothetical protein